MMKMVNLYLKMVNQYMTYKTYENLLDPIVSFVRMMVDFAQECGPFVKDKEFG